MPAYNFLQMWEAKLHVGEKYTTIRRRRKRPTKAGDTIFLYVGLRTKSCRLVATAPCVKVTPVTIYPFEMLLKMYNYVLPIKKTVQIARVDGFSDLRTFFKFFERYKEPVLMGFEIIEWDPKRLDRPVRGLNANVADWANDANGEEVGNE